MENYERTITWQKTLGLQNVNGQTVVDHYRVIFFAFRKKVQHIAAGISRSLPDYTVHDITHIDALWEMADQICGAEYALTPLEGFVLGGAFLLHDLAMSVSAFPEGIAELERLPLWHDTVIQKSKDLQLEIPEQFTYSSLNQELKEQVLTSVLRKQHAKAAEQLLTAKWRDQSKGEDIYLIEDIEIRTHFGRVIGQIAHSHWWSIEEVEAKFTRPIGAPANCPGDWVVDPLKLACILRTCDAAQIDSRRAPIFLRSLSNLNSTSDQHWAFQGKLSVPYLVEDSLCYTSGYEFPVSEASAWWLCYETLKMIDHELRSTDALLADKRMDRFKARRVQAIDSPERLSSLIRTYNWNPIDAYIHVGNLPKLIRALGGEELYGRDMSVPIRELIQNAADAIRARRQLERRNDEWGLITVQHKNDDEGDWIEIEDNGIGMSVAVVKNILFEFGTSYWNSELLQAEHPGLIAKGISNTGKYGIGFYSIFMLGDEVSITTRKCNKAQSDTFVVEFICGLSARPIIRNATDEEHLIDGGTRISIKLRDGDFKNVFKKRRQAKTISIHTVVNDVAPALDCHIETIDASGVERIPANFWLHSSNEEFLRYVYKLTPSWFYLYQENSEFEIEKVVSVAKNLVGFIEDANGTVVGRGLLASDHEYNAAATVPACGLITVGGLSEANVEGEYVGILCGAPTNAARNKPRLLAEREDIIRWCSVQVPKIPNLYNEDEQIQISNLLLTIGAKTEAMKVAQTIADYLSWDELVEYIKSKDCIKIVDVLELSQRLLTLSDVSFEKDVLYLSLGLRGGITLRFHMKELWQEANTDELYSFGPWGAIAEAWGTTIEAIFDFILDESRPRNSIHVATLHGQKIDLNGLEICKAQISVDR